MAASTSYPNPVDDLNECPHAPKVPAAVNSRLSKSGIVLNDSPTPAPTKSSPEHSWWGDAAGIPSVTAATSKYRPRDNRGLGTPPSPPPQNACASPTITEATKKQPARSGISLDAPPEHSIEGQWLADAIESTVDRVYTRMERHFAEQKAELAAKEKAAEKALKARTKKEKKEREEERKELVEKIREMALELEDREPEIEEPVVLKDAVGRKFIFPFEACRTWTGFSGLIKQAFQHVDVLGQHVNDGFYDIFNPKGLIILPAVWDEVIQPGWEISMHMWPMPEPYMPPPGPRPSTVEIIEDSGSEWSGPRKSEGKGHRARGRQDNHKEENSTWKQHRPYRLDEKFEDDNEPLKGSESMPAPLEISVVSTRGDSSVREELSEKPAAEEDQAEDWDVLDD